MKTFLIAASACALLAACAADHPAPGQAPGWDSPTPPRGSMDLPVPFRDQYMPPSSHKIHELPPAPEGHNVPYAVRGEGALGAGAVPHVNPEGTSLTPAEGASDTGCHAIPPTVFEGKPTSTMCRQPDGRWTFIPD